MIARVLALLRGRSGVLAAPIISAIGPSTLLRLGAVAVIGGFAIYGVSFIHPEPVAKVGPVSIAHPWAKGGARVGQQLPVYATFSNAALTADRLISATSTIADRAIIKELDMRGGFVAARELDALKLPAQSRQTLRPGQSQITLDGVKMAIGPGDRVPLTLHFERAGIVKVMVDVENIGQPDHPEHFPSADQIDERGLARR
jgi:copper(I)-binding protein